MKCPMPMYGIPGMMGRSRKGAWIEIDDVNGFRHAVAGRSRKGAWIEIKIRFLCCGEYGVAPVRERGLKFHKIPLYSCLLLSLP